MRPRTQAGAAAGLLKGRAGPPEVTGIRRDLPTCDRRHHRRTIAETCSRARRRASSSSHGHCAATGRASALEVVAAPSRTETVTRPSQRRSAMSISRTDVARSEIRLDQIDLAHRVARMGVEPDEMITRSGRYQFAAGWRVHRLAEDGAADPAHNGALTMLSEPRSRRPRRCQDRTASGGSRRTSD